jgi:enoyl-CoA hydratase/carnithine racemase/acyl carrier protein
MGGDKKSLEEISNGKAQFTDIDFLYKGILTYDVPVIAAIQGHARGGGMLLGLYADVVIMEEGSTYSANFMNFGFTPGMGSTMLLKEKMGDLLGKEMMLTGKIFTGVELKNRGSKVIFGKGINGVMTEAINLANTFIDKPRAALKVLKDSFSKELLIKLPNAIEEELEMHGKTFHTDEVRDRIGEIFNSGVIENETPKKKNGIKSTSLNKTSGEEVAEAILKILENILHIESEKIDRRASYNELGIDSISAVEIVRDINLRFKTNLESVIIYSYPSIDSLSEYLAREIDKTKEVTKRLSYQEHRDVEVVDITKDYLSKEETKNVKEYHESYKEDQKENTKTKENLTEDIAIIGISGEFPGARDLEELWKNIEAGKNNITEVPRERWDMEKYYSEKREEEGKSYSKWGGFVSEIDKFDPLFFSISPMEAELMDPQQRLFLQEAWKTFEDAGYSKEQIFGKKCGVFVGASTSDYSQITNDLEGKNINAYTLMGQASSILASRISYLLNLKGPSLGLDTACSSSLVAIHEACRSIQSGESEMALAGGVYVMTTPLMHIMTSKANMLAGDGKCKTFDNDADGFVIGFLGINDV